MKENFKILDQKIIVQNKSNEKVKNSLKYRDIGIDTTNFNEFYDNSFNFKEIKSNYLSNLISFSFLKKVGSFYQWPFLCFGNIIQNIILENNNKNINIDIDINCYDDEIYKRLSCSPKTTNYHDYIPPDSNPEIYNGDFTKKILVLSIKDDSLGIDSETFNKMLFCFDSTNIINEKINSFNKTINLKACCLRLGESFFVLSKTKNELNIGLISRQLQTKMNNDLILAPLVNYTIIKNKDNNNKYIFKSQVGLQSENIILSEIRFLFWSIKDLFSYADKFQSGTHIFIYDLKQFSANKDYYNKATNFELFFSYMKNNENNTFNDILYNTLLKQSFLYDNNSDNFNNVIDLSLRKYLKYIFIGENKINIKLMKNDINIKNNILNQLYNNLNIFQNNISIKENILIVDDAFNFNKKLDLKKINIIVINGELYKGVIIKKNKDETILNNLKECFEINININDIREIKENDILIYLGNRLVCRLGQNKFGDLPFFLKKIKQNNKKGIYNYYGFIILPNNGLYELTSTKNEFNDNTIFSMFFCKISNLIRKINK